MRRLGVNVVATFSLRQDFFEWKFSYFQISHKRYSAKKYEKVLVVYTDFISALTQKPNIKQTAGLPHQIWKISWIPGRIPPLLNRRGLGESDYLLKEIK